MKRVFTFWSLAVFSATWLLFGGCSVQETILRAAFVGGGEFASPAGQPAEEFVQHTERVYSFRRNFYRTLIVDTDAGVVVIDPMNPELARAARKIIDEKLGKPVHTLIYSHYHLDHVRGGKQLDPGAVIAHERCDFYWKHFGTRHVLPPTARISGDTVLDIGGVRIEAHYHGLSHTDTLFSFYLPDEKLVYAPDLGFIDSFGTPGPFNTFYYGYKRAMERVVKLPFEHFIPSHGKVGNHKDFENALAFYVDVREITAEAVKVHGYGETREEMATLFDAIYPRLKEKYGHLHGFDQMVLPNIVRHMAGESLGY